MCVWTLSEPEENVLLAESSTWVDSDVCCAVLGDCMCVHIRWRLEVWIHCTQDEFGENGLVRTRAQKQKRWPYV